MKHLFYDDYSEGAHPEILQYIAEHNSDQQRGYGRDDYSELAAKRIKTAFGLPGADIHFLPNGTSCNVIGLKAMLQSYEGVIAPASGHINTHEAGALEAAGHKIIWIEASDGKLTADLIDEALSRYEDEHTVVPRVVYLTQVTELGTVYTKDEILRLIAHAKTKGLYVFLDGARLAMAIASKAADMSARDVGALGLDMFYIGGTKNGGLYGEALVIQNERFKPYFRSVIKQRNGMMAKGRFIGLQFARFFDEDDLWLTLARHANAMAERLYAGLKELGVAFDLAPGANQLFPILDNAVVEKLRENYGFYDWRKIGADRTQVRFVCSWATPESKVDAFIADVKQALKAG
ncbi:aminotransferase class I/II-fold pyridoxal phosphate-dependent enzyme [Methylocystis sp. 9N]|uniref:Aminotransferase class I/II-fold pyridoxal phosphate-dependent enzyme n=1 Tax=Methylocystis borbori TaxID=3118750 RepID=A0ABU7XL04_9HYPH